jgi:hypothetical protein
MAPTAGNLLIRKVGRLVEKSLASALLFVGESHLDLARIVRAEA